MATATMTWQEEERLMRQKATERMAGYRLDNTIIQPAVKVFQDMVYLKRVASGGLFERIQRSTKRGMSGQIGTSYSDCALVRIFVMAGRVMVTLIHPYNENTTVTMLFAEGEADPRGGLQSYEGTREDAIALLYRAINNAHNIVLEDDGDVSIGFATH